MALVGILGIADGAEASGAESSSESSLADLHLPPGFLQRLADRATIDNFQIEYHRTEANRSPAPRALFAARRRVDRYIDILISKPSADVALYRSALPAAFAPLRGYRAPVLEQANAAWPALAVRSELDSQEVAAAELVARRVADDGLLSTLVQVVAALGPERFTTNDNTGLADLKAVGVPVDWLAYFSATNGQPEDVVTFIATQLAGGATVEAINQDLDTYSFQFRQSHPSFAVATESGEDELGTLRLQVGGGYQDGIVPGGSIDVVCQLVRSFPGLDFLISIPNEYRDSFFEMAAQTWRLRRTNQVTLISEPFPVAAWAQDNGKAGTLFRDQAPGTASGAAPRKLATLIPRYASIDAGRSRFEKGESFLMDGLKAAGHEVVQSPLLFQGGNLLAVRDPKTGERLLLVGEGELHRNMTLGLTRPQALQTFRIEFGVDRCIEVPAVSYHLDFDVCVRSHNGELIAFVNDPMAAARAIVDLGISALEKAGILDPDAARAARGHLESGRDLDLLRLLRTIAPRRAPDSRGYPATFCRGFASSQIDSDAGNVQCFLLALDLLESSLDVTQPVMPGPDPSYSEYLEALRRNAAARAAQTETFRHLGWKIVAIPSMGDLYRGINYLNGIHHRDGYIMPGFGGFYAPLDQAASAAFREVLGSEFKITTLLTAESQRNHGGVHCTTAPYPRL